MPGSSPGMMLIEMARFRTLTEPRQRSPSYSLPGLKSSLGTDDGCAMLSGRGPCGRRRRRGKRSLRSPP